MSLDDVDPRAVPKATDILDEKAMSYKEIMTLINSKLDYDEELKREEIRNETRSYLEDLEKRNREKKEKEKKLRKEKRKKQADKAFNISKEVLKVLSGVPLGMIIQLLR